MNGIVMGNRNESNYFDACQIENAMTEKLAENHAKTMAQHQKNRQAPARAVVHKGAAPTPLPDRIVNATIVTGDPIPTVPMRVELYVQHRLSDWRWWLAALCLGVGGLLYVYTAAPAPLAALSLGAEAELALGFGAGVLVLPALLMAISLLMRVTFGVFDFVWGLIIGLVQIAGKLLMIAVGVGLAIGGLAVLEYILR